MADEAQPPADDSLPASAPAVASAEAASPGAAQSAAAKALPHDFRNPVFMSENELRRLRLQHDEFARFLSSRFSMYLRMEFTVKVTNLTTATYSRFTESLGNPTHLSLFKVEPLAGVGLLELNPRLALTIADRLLGGRGQVPAAGRGLTEIEIALIEDVIDILLVEWSSQWKPAQDVRPLIIGHENNGRFLQTSSRDTVMLVLGLEATFGECVESIQLGVPYAMIEPVIKKLESRRIKEAPVAPAEKRPGWQGSYNRITMPVQAEWDALELTLRELSQLRVGDVIEMPSSIFKETRVLFSGTPKFIGTVGLDGDRVAVQLNHKLPTADSPHGKPDARKIS
jgi:flagellar motor switch protein FliM